MPTKLFSILLIFAVIFIVSSIVRVWKKDDDDSLFCILYDYALATMIVLGIGVGIMCMFSLIDARNHKEYKYEAVYSEEIQKFIDCYDKKGYHVCIDGSGTENIVDRYWKRGEKPKEDEKINEEDSLPNLKYEGMKDDKVKKYVSCEDEENGPVCTAEDGTKHEVDSYWRFKTQKEKDEENSGTIITPIIPSIVVH